MDNLTQLFIIIGAVAYLETALMAKDGPLRLIVPIRGLFKHLGENNPFECWFCGAFWISLIVLVLWQLNIPFIMAVISIFGVAGLSLGIRSLFQEWSIK